jgi:Skp family chaperone for outer membrane proteins
MSGQDNSVENFAQEPLAEGPLIKYTPGGTAAGRALDSGLPPARAQLGGGEFWGQLVQPGNFNLDTTGGGGGGGSVDDPIVDDTEGLVEEDEQFWEDQNKFHDDMAYEYKPVDWEYGDLIQDYEPIAGYRGYDYTTDALYTPEFGGSYGLSAGRGASDRPIDRPTKDPITGDPKKEVPTWLWKQPEDVGPWKKEYDFDTKTPLFPRMNEWLTRNKGKTEQDFRNEQKAFYEYKQEYYDKNNRVLTKGLTNGMVEIEKLIDSVIGPRAADQRPTKEAYAKSPILKYTDKFKQAFDGLSAETIQLWETRGIAADPSGKLPFGPELSGKNVQALMKNVGTSLANFTKIIQGKGEEVQALKQLDPQKYGQLQVLAIINAAALVNAYGPYGLIPSGLSTIGSDLASAINGSLAKQPEFAGNPVQDLLHGTVWIGGKAAQLAYNKTLGSFFPKTQIKDKASIIDSAKTNLKTGEWSKQLFEYRAPKRTTGMTITYNPPKPVEGPQPERTTKPLGMPPKGRETFPEPQTKLPPRTTTPMGPAEGRGTFPEPPPQVVGSETLTTTPVGQTVETTGEPAEFPYKPRGPRLKPTDTKTTLGEDELNELNKLGIVEQRQSDWESQNLVGNADDYNNLNAGGWIEHGNKPYIHTEQQDDSGTQIQIADLDEQLRRLENEGLMGEANEVRFKIIELEGKLQQGAKETKIPSPLQLYLNGTGTAEEATTEFQGYLEQVQNQEDVSNIMGQVDHEQNMQDLTNKVYEASLANQAARDEFNKKRQEEASEQNKATGEAAEKSREETKEYIKQAEESGKRIMQGVKDSLKKDRARLQELGIISKEQGDFMDAIVASGGLRVEYDGEDGSIRPTKDKQGRVRGYIYISPDDAEYIDNKKGGFLDWRDPEDYEGKGGDTTGPGGNTELERGIYVEMGPQGTDYYIVSPPEFQNPDE